MNKTTYILLFLALSPFCWAEEDNAKDAPDELKPLVDEQHILLAHAEADLNGDGLSDYVFILQRQKNSETEPDIEEGQRPLKIALRMPDKSLKVVKTNDKVVYCSSCGGVFGDPFESLSAQKKSFTISHYGGSNWRWAKTYKFNYSRIDDTWQLVQVQEHSYHASDPERMESTTYRPPADFGKIDIADFDPENFRGAGQR